MIKLIKSTFYREKDTKAKLVKFLRTASQLSFGPQCEVFENNFASWQGRKYCIFLNSGSSANLAIIQALLNLNKLKKGDYVGFSALTWSTNVMPLIQLGLIPIPIDVELETLNISSNKLLNVLEKLPIKALFLTNLLGFCGDIDQIRFICKERGILLIEDNCESLGSIYQGKKLGNFGLASTFSFYVGHHMSTIEGGAVCCDAEYLEVMLKIIRAHGWDRNLSFSKQNDIRSKFKVNSTFYSRYTFYDLGYNLRPTEISGFLGNLQLSYVNKIVKKRQQNFIKFARSLYKHTDRYYPLKYDHMELISNFAVPIICRSKEIRDELVKMCEGKIEIRPIVGGDITLQPFFKKYVKGKNIFANENSRLVHEQGLYFGNNPDLTIKEINQILNLFASN